MEAASNGDTSPTSLEYDIHHTRHIHMDHTTSLVHTIRGTKSLARE
ncbi:hypothetical protein KSZ_32920 [Dictyobacter formicarum]|uniref:Uncharacterized protein n=1 Tax=Dictyobacter formicarum TaxID=2778368 RepID=A0ABQ3VII5_9CHLR|nr:hypothetical protein KSZ_32920 [Dictyobacter formicarum]